MLKWFAIPFSRGPYFVRTLHQKAMFFSVFTYGCESWTIKKAERQRIDDYELWCWRRLLRVPWTARRSKQSILKEISPECSLEGLMLKLTLHYFGPLLRRTDTLENTLMLGKIEGRRRRGRQRMRWLDGITDSMDMSLSKLWVGDGQGSLACCSPWGRKESDTTEWLNWIAKNDPTPNARSARAGQLITCFHFINRCFLNERREKT